MQRIGLLHILITNRRQFVTVNGIESDLTNISCGIPQGSVLGPILFLLYINDFYLCSTIFDFHLFADDANLFCRHKDINILRQNINTELNNVSLWLRSNKLSLNIQKSNFVIFHPPRKKIFCDFQLILENKLLNQEKCIKYLGVFIDSSMSWKSQIQFILTKIKRSVGILSKVRHYVDINVLCNLYYMYALIYPFLIYGIIAWGNTFSTTLQPLFILQKQAICLITFISFHEHSSPTFRKLNIIKLDDLISYHIQCSTLTLARLPGPSEIYPWASKTTLTLADPAIRISGLLIFCRTISFAMRK